MKNVHQKLKVLFEFKLFFVKQDFFKSKINHIHLNYKTNVVFLNNPIVTGIQLIPLNVIMIGSGDNYGISKIRK